MALICECGGDLKMTGQFPGKHSTAECVACGKEWSIAASDV